MTYSPAGPDRLQGPSASGGGHLPVRPRPRRRPRPLVLEPLSICS